MADPFKIEKQFQTLRQSIALIASQRLRLLRIVEFVDSTSAGDDGLFLQAYIPELLFSFWPLARACDFTGTSIVVLRRLIQFSESMSRHFPDIAQGDEWGPVLKHLHEEENRIVSWLEKRKDAGRSDLLPISEAAHDAIWIPLVETELLIDAGPIRFGTLRRLHVRGIPKSRGSSQDELYVGQPTSKEEQIREELLSGVGAARSLLQLCIGEQGRTPLVVQGWLEGPQAVSGPSIQAGLALALFAGQLHHHGHREQYSLYHTTAVTGSIDASGRLLSVDPEGLRTKIEACTFSWIKHVVVPAEQADIARLYAREAVAALDVEPVEIVGAHTIADILANRRLTELRRIPWYTRTAKQIWKRRMQAAMVLILLLVLILARAWYGPVDREPTEAAFRQDYLVIKNAHGDILDSFLPEEGKLNQQFDKTTDPVLVDVDADRSKEVIYGVISPDGIYYLQCRSLVAHSSRWTIRLKQRVVFPHQSGTEKEDFHLENILAGDFDGDSKVEVLCLAVHDLFPCLVLKIDANSGRTVSAYLNTGHLNSVAAVDLDGDTRPEIVLAGVNNALRHACIVVLDPRHIEGCSPSTPEYAPPEEWKPAMHRAYLQIPKTVIAEAFGQIAKWNLAHKIDVNDSSKTLTIKLSDQTIVAEYKADLYLNLDFGLHPLSFSTCDGYDMTAERMVAEGLLNQKPDKRYFDALRSEVLCWDGMGWKSTMSNERVSNLLPAVE
jgi:hypothetical protein